MGLLKNSLFFFCLLAVPAAETTEQDSVADLVKKSSEAVVLITISDSSGRETALGSGFLVTADGEIVTNYHVIKDAHSAIVKLSNGAFFPVNGVLASDAEKDLAILKVNGKNLPFLTIGDLSRVQVGEHVVAIGSPLGLEGTVSDGVVSAVREVAGKKWIQTTAPASHGNSGGPLLDMNNNVVGVIALGVNPEVGQNLNFAVPCDEVASLLISAHEQSKSLDSVASKVEGSFTEGKLWTSVTNGHDFNLRQDGDYIYLDMVNIPQQARDGGGFVRGELKKVPDGTWKGKQHSRMPCEYSRGRGLLAQTATNWCSVDLDMEIHSMTERRIEGVTSMPTKFDCRKCEQQGKIEQQPFTWIPK